MTQTEATGQLTKGTTVRFRNSLLSTARLTVRLDRAADVAPVEGTSGQVYAILYGYRVRPNDLSVSFGARKVYCVNVNAIEIVKGA